MNERIKQLALQADAIILGSVQSKSAGLLIEKWEQKFAELIIDEVYSFLLNPSSDDEPWPSRVEVKKHFGVE